MPPLTRRERANRVKKRNVFTQYGPVARQVLDALLDKYADEGMATLEADNVLSLRPSPSWAAGGAHQRSFGGRPQVPGSPAILERELYAPVQADH
jgi:type I restriction enzyme R subunit